MGNGLKVQIDIAIRSDDDSKEFSELARDASVNIIIISVTRELDEFIQDF